LPLRVTTFPDGPGREPWVSEHPSPYGDLPQRTSRSCWASARAVQTAATSALSRRSWGLQRGSAAAETSFTCRR
jgi:hypothetical protein